MLTNEQRAHDLAVYMLDTVKESRIQEQISLGSNKVAFEFYEEYKNYIQQF